MSTTENTKALNAAAQAAQEAAKLEAAERDLLAWEAAQAEKDAIEAAQEAEKLAKLEVIVWTDGKGATKSVYPMRAPTVTFAQAAETLRKASDVRYGLALNLLANKVDPAIEDAAKVKGGLATLFANAGAPLAQADRAAINLILNTKPTDRVAGWTRYVLACKRATEISLQGIAKGIENKLPKAAPKTVPAAPSEDAADAGETETPTGLHAKLAAWCKANDPGELPVSLFDLLIEAGVITDVKPPKGKEAPKPERRSRRLHKGRA